MKKALVLSILFAPALANATLICQQPRFLPAPSEIFSVTSTLSQVVLNWKGGDYPKVEQLLKFIDPKFSDRVIAVSTTFSRNECLSTRSPFIIACRGSGDRTIQIKVASGREFTFSGVPTLTTSTTKRTFLAGHGSKIESEQVVNPVLALEIHPANSRPLYSLAENETGFVTSQCSLQESL